MIYDVAILGGGVAGWSAGIYSTRYNLKTIIIAKVFGGTTLESHIIKNYPGFLSISGTELTKKFREQAEKFGAKLLQGEIIDVEQKGKKFDVILKNKGGIKANTLIITLGIEKKRLGIKNEEGFLGKGLSYCAICDGFFYKGKDVVVIGGGDSALHSALLLSEFAKTVKILYRGNKLRAQPKLQQEVKRKNNIKVIYNTIVKKFLGEDRIETIEIERNGKKEMMKAGGVFIEIGQIPRMNLTKKLGLKLDKKGYVKVNEAMRTNKKGIFAAGDITTGSNKLRQVVTGVAEGAIAATSAYNYLKEKEAKNDKD